MVNLRLLYRRSLLLAFSIPGTFIFIALSTELWVCRVFPASWLRLQFSMAWLLKGNLMMYSTVGSGAGAGPKTEWGFQVKSFLHLETLQKGRFCYTGSWSRSMLSCVAADSCHTAVRRNFWGWKLSSTESKDRKLVGQVNRNPKEYMVSHNRSQCLSICELYLGI